MTLGKALSKQSIYEKVRTQGADVGGRAAPGGHIPAEGSAPATSVPPPSGHFPY